MRELGDWAWLRSVDELNMEASWPPAPPCRAGSSRPASDSGPAPTDEPGRGDDDDDDDGGLETTSNDLDLPHDDSSPTDDDESSVYTHTVHAAHSATL